MKRVRLLTTLCLIAAMAFAMTSVSYADEYTVSYSCAYDGADITTNFDQAAYDSLVSELEPGDSIQYIATYFNHSDKKTRWFLKTDVLKSLEEGTADGGGYLGSLKNSNQDASAPEVLFDNTLAGGDEAATEGGMKELTNATEEYFSIGTLKAGQKGTVTMNVRFDGETENNDYEDTAGKLFMQFAVEDTSDGNRTVQENQTKTGDSSSIALMVAVMIAALLAAVLAILSYRKDRKGGDQA